MAINSKAWLSAIQRGSIQEVAEAIKLGADVSAPIESYNGGDTLPLIQAANDENVELAKLLLESGTPVDQTLPAEGNNVRGTALCHVVCGKSLPLVELLVSHGADVNYCADDGTDSPLDIAVFEATNESGVEIVRFLLNHGADPLHPKYGHRVLRSAGMGRGAKGIVTELIQRGSDPNQPACFDELPIMPAIECNDLCKVKEFLENGADPLLKSPDTGQNAIELARSSRKKKIAAYLESFVEQQKGAAGNPATTLPTKKPPSRKSIMNQIDVTLQNQDRGDTLCPGASAEDIRALEETTGLELGNELTDYFRWHNGQADYQCTVRIDSGDRFYLLGIEEIKNCWSAWHELLEFGEFDDCDVSNEVGVSADWWNAKWLPVAGNGAGDSLCIDFAPDSSGRHGQIISVWHENGKREIEFASLSELLMELLEVFHTNT